MKTLVSENSTQSILKQARSETDFDFQLPESKPKNEFNFDFPVWDPNVK